VPSREGSPGFEKIAPRLLTEGVQEFGFVGTIERTGQ
jgi:hypothetical protein